MSPVPAPPQGPIRLEPIGHVRNARRQVEDDRWGGIISEIEIDLGAEAIEGIEEFSHAEIVFYFDRVDPGNIERGARHPRGNPAWPRVGILAQRGKDRPNRLGLTIVKILKRAGNILTVSGLDALDGTPVLDIKPLMKEFMPAEPLRQPGWVAEMMKDYWKGNEDK